MEAAAVEIAYAEGVDAVTVARVCEAAGVSRSTFFNYFWSLEQAIFGAPIGYDAEMTERILTEHADDLVLAAGLIVVEHVRHAQGDTELGRRRFALFVREPGMSSHVAARSRASRDALVAVVERWLDDHPERARLPGPDHGAEARLAVGLSIALGDEALPRLTEVDGDHPLDLAVFREARARMAAVAADGLPSA